MKWTDKYNKNELEFYLANHKNELERILDRLNYARQEVAHHELQYTKIKKRINELEEALE
jgi:predicted  nucleic acid-binding Zn-ribbon protein